jgi:dTDP-4-dehydrorhamnose reductase
MKILVTGSNGLLGQKLVYLLSSKSDVNLLATSKGSNRLNCKEGYQYQTLDITDQKEVDTVTDQFKPDIIINTAAMTNVDACEENHELCWDLNVNAVKNLISVSERNGIHLVHLSTDFVFDGEEGPYKEDDRPNPLSYYGKSKYEAEKLLQSSKTKWSIARTIIVYGVTENMSRSNIVLWAKEALEMGKPLNIVEDQYRMPTLAEDLAEGCWLIAQKGKTGIYHLSGKDFMSIIELVYKVADHYNLDKTIITPIQSKTLNQPAKRPPKTGFFLKKAINDLGYTPHSFSEGLNVLDKQLSAIN